MGITRWIFFIAYLVGVYVIGYFAYKKTAGLSEFYVAGKSLGTIEMTAAFTSAFVSASSILGYVAFAYSNGWSMILLYGGGCALGWILLSLVAPKLTRFEKGVTSPDIFAERFYSEKMRLLFAIVFIMWQALFLVQQFMGIGYVLEAFLGIPYWIGVLIIGVTLVIYISSGGMRSVVWTDVLQVIIMIVGVFIAAIVVMVMTGGFSGLNQAASTVVATGKPVGFMTSMTGGFSWLYLIGIAIPLGMIIVTVPFYHRMFFSVKNVKTAVGGIGISTLILIPFYLCIGIIGVGARQFLPSLATPDRAFPTLVSTTMSPLMGTLILTCIVAAIMSSLDSLLLAVGAMCSHDIFKGFIKKDATEKQELEVTRWSIIVIGLAGALVSLKPPATIIGMYNIIIGVVSSTLFPALLLGLFWKRTTKEGAFIGSIVGCIVAWVWIAFGPKAIPAALIGVPVGAILVVVISLFTPEPPKTALAQFFDDEKVALKNQSAQSM